MDPREISTIDSLWEYMGGCGLFQFLAVITMHGATMSSPWAMTFMAYGNFNPGWTCADDDDYNSTSRLQLQDPNPNGIDSDNGTAATSDKASCELFKRCKDVVFNNETSTIVTEWNLACDRSWIMSMMISVQMTGVLLGGLVAGQLNHFWGRKKTLYGTLAVHALLNLVASFSASWQVFTAFRFFVGMTCGSIILTAFVYPMEFVNIRWRGVVAALPFSSISGMTFSLTAMLLRDWRQLNRATAVLTTLFFLPVFWAPDSVRWLAVNNKTKKAEKAVLKIAKTNRKQPPPMEVIGQIAETERRVKESKRHVNMLDLYRHGLLIRTLVTTLAWMTNIIIYYTILFDVQSLSGNFFVNLILFPAISVITLPFVPLLTNTIGRKWGIIVLMGLASISCFILVVLNFVDADVDKGLARVIIVFIIMMCIDYEWAIVQLYCVELYPTVLRSISYSHSCCFARVGGMIAPFLIPRDESSTLISQIVMGVLLGFTCLCIFFLPETKDRPMEESVTLHGVKADKRPAGKERSDGRNDETLI